jgi:SAM-dependent methyltransferase
VERTVVVSSTKRRRSVPLSAMTNQDTAVTKRRRSRSALARSWLRKACKRMAFFGFKYQCPLCNSRLRMFLPSGRKSPVLDEKHVVGAGRRQNALCPVCGSLDRERLVFLYLASKTDVFEGRRTLLHVAPEERLSLALRSASGVTYLSADIASREAMVNMDVTAIGLPSSSLDVVICNHVLEHVVDDARAMAELYRILKPGGWAIVQVPISPTLVATYEDFSITSMAGRKRAFGQEDHVRIYGRDYEERLKRVGFEVRGFEWLSEAESFGGRRNVFGLNPSETVYWARKCP